MGLTCDLQGIDSQNQPACCLKAPASALSDVALHDPGKAVEQIKACACVGMSWECVLGLTFIGMAPEQAARWWSGTVCWGVPWPRPCRTPASSISHSPTPSTGAPLNKRTFYLAVRVCIHRQNAVGTYHSILTAKLRANINDIKEHMLAYSMRPDWSAVCLLMLSARKTHQDPSPHAIAWKQILSRTQPVPSIHVHAPFSCKCLRVPST